VYWDRALEIMTGIKSEDIVGTRDHWKAFYALERPCLADLVLDPDREKILTLFPEIGSVPPDADGRFAYTGFFKTPGNGGKWLHITAMPVRDPVGNLTGAMETVEDVTEKKQREFIIQD
jgi:PAS domain-containing protein